MPMTPMAILKNVDYGRHERAEIVKIVGLKTGKSKKTGLFKAIFKAYSRRPGAHNAYHYACAITQLNKKSHVRVSCSCPDFLFRWEYFLWKKGAAEIYYCNGEAPQVPRKPACCKHLVMSFKTLFEKGMLNGDLTFR